MIKKLAVRKSKGKIELITGMFFISFLLLIISVHMQIMLFSITSYFMEDALAASNLASAIVDIQEYGSTNMLCIGSPENAYVLYKEALKTNLQLNENWESVQKDLISGRVEVIQYIIYNVRGQDVTIYCFGKEGENFIEETGGLGSVKTPDGTLVEATTVYSRIGFPVESILGISVYAEKEKSVDIVKGNL